MKMMFKEIGDAGYVDCTTLALMVCRGSGRDMVLCSLLAVYSVSVRRKRHGPWSRVYHHTNLQWLHIDVGSSIPPASTSLRADTESPYPAVSRGLCRPPRARSRAGTCRPLSRTAQARGSAAAEWPGNPAVRAGICEPGARGGSENRCGAHQTALAVAGS